MLGKDCRAHKYNFGSGRKVSLCDQTIELDGDLAPRSLHYLLAKPMVDYWILQFIIFMMDRCHGYRHGSVEAARVR